MTRVRTLLLGAALAVAAVVLRLPALHQPLDRDESWYAFIGSRMGRGFVPYRDFFEHKQPLVYPVYWLIERAAPLSQPGVRIAAAVVAALAVVLVLLLARRAIEPAHAALAAALVVVASASTHVEGVDLNTEHLLVPVAISAVLAPLALRQSRSAWIAFGAGLLAGTAVLAKAVGVLAVIAGLLPLVWNRRGRLQRLGAYAAGAAVPITLFVGVYAALGGLADAWRATVVYNLRYVRHFPPLPWWRWMTFPLSIQVLVGAAVLVAAVRLATERGRDVTTWTVLLWMVGAIAGAKLGRREAPHYYAPVIVPAAMLVCLRTVPRNRAALASAVLALAVALPFLADASSRFGADPDELAVRQYGPQARLWAAQDDLGAWLRAHGRPSDRLFVTGAEGSPYWLSRMTPASYYLFDYPSEIIPDEYYPRVRRDLEASPPRFVVLTIGPELPEPLRSLPYRRVAQFGPAIVMRLG